MRSIKQRFYNNISTIKKLTFGVLIAIGFTFLFIYLNKSFDEYIGKHITYSEYDPEEIRRLYLQTSSKELNLEKLIQFTFDTFRKYFDTGEQEIYITDKETKGIPFHYNSNHKEKLVDGEKIYSLAGLKNGFETLLISVGDLKANSEEKHKELIEYMDYFDFQFVTELEISTQYSGYIFIGSKVSNEAYTHEEVNLMQDIIFTFAASISRALLHLATEKFNDLLSRKVEEQTKEITEQNQQLKDAYEAERDRMNILSHELRTLLGTTRNAVSIIKMLFEGKKMDTLNPKVIECLSLLVKGNEAVVSIQDLFNKDLLSKDNPLASQSVNLLAASMKAVEVLMELYKNNEFITPNQSVEKNLDIALENLRREVVLLERIFTVSQIRAGTLNIMSTKVSCNEAIDKAVESFAHLAEKKGVQVEIIKPSEDIIIQSDGVRVKEIVANLFENAAKYTNEGKVVIGYEDIGNKVRFFVKDTGIGIPKEEISKIGQEEYYKVDKYLQSSSNDKLPLTRPDGTGLGMYVIRHLAILLKGELIIGSELGKGSQFYVTLPK